MTVILGLNRSAQRAALLTHPVANRNHGGVHAFAVLLGFSSLTTPSASLPKNVRPFLRFFCLAFLPVC